MPRSIHDLTEVDLQFLTILMKTLDKALEDNLEYLDGLDEKEEHIMSMKRKQPAITSIKNPALLVDIKELMGYASNKQIMEEVSHEDKQLAWKLNDIREDMQKTNDAILKLRQGIPEIRRAVVQELNEPKKN